MAIHRPSGHQSPCDVAADRRKRGERRAGGRGARTGAGRHVCAARLGRAVGIKNRECCLWAGVMPNTVLNWRPLVVRDSLPSSQVRKLKIAIVSGFYSEGMGYSENCLSKALAKLGHDVHVVTSTYNVYGSEPLYDADYREFLGPATTAVGPA